MLNTHKDIKVALEDIIKHNLNCKKDNNKLYKYILKSFNSKHNYDYMVETGEYFLSTLIHSHTIYNQLIYNNKPIRFVFKTNTTKFLTELCNELCFNKFQLVIYRDKKKKDGFYIIYPNIYFNNKKELNSLLEKQKNKYPEIEMIEDMYIPHILNETIEVISPINLKKISSFNKLEKEKLFNNTILNPIDIEDIEPYYKDNVNENIDTINIDKENFDEILESNGHVDISNDELLLKKQSKLLEIKNLKHSKSEEKKLLKKELKKQKQLEKEQQKLKNHQQKKENTLKQKELNELKLIGEDKFYVEDVVEKELEDINNSNIVINDNILTNNTTENNTQENDNYDKEEVNKEEKKGEEEKSEEYYEEKQGCEESNDVEEDIERVERKRYMLEEVIKDTDIILYNNLDEIGFNTDNKYIFKIIQFKEKKVLDIFYIYEKLDKIIKLKNLIEDENIYGVYQYIDYNKPIRLYFYLRDIDNLEEICEFLDIKLEDIIIQKINMIQPTSYAKLNKYDNPNENKKYLIIHKEKYFNTKSGLDIYLFKMKLTKYYINIEINTYIPFIFSKYIKLVNYDKEKMDNKLEILETLDALETPKKINMILKYSILNIYTKEDKKSLMNITENINRIDFKKKYVDCKDFDKNADILFIKSSMGSGKSTSLVNYINNMEDVVNKKILIISSRITLSNTIYQKFSKTDIKFSNYLSINNEDTLTNCLKLIISPNSLIKLQEPLQKYDVVWIDEATSLITYLVSFPYYDLRNILDVLFRIIYQTKQLILTDADIDELLIEIYTKIKQTKNYKLLSYNNYNKVNELIYSSVSNIYNNICEDIKNGKNLYICSDSIRETKKIYNAILDNSEIIDKDIMLYNSESIAEYDRYITEGVNKFWNKYRVVIVSPKVIYGIDFTENHFHRVYGIYKGGNILSCREISQQLNRIRNILDKEITINIVKNNNNLISDIFTFKYYLEKKYYNRIYLNKLSLGSSNRLEFDNLLNILTFIYNDDNYRLLDINNPYNLMVLYKIIEKNKGLNKFEL